MKKGEAICYKRKLISWTRRTQKDKDCMIFAFKESIVVCEKVPSLFPQPEFSQNCLLDYWVSFQVIIIITAVIISLSMFILISRFIMSLPKKSTGDCTMT